MPIEIKVLKQFGSVPVGLYPARYLNEKGQNFMAATLNPCKDAQIIDGPYSGEILPYSAYIVTGELPAQAELLQVKEKLVNDLAEAGRKITEYARKTGRLQETAEALEEQKQYLVRRVDSMEKTNLELNDRLRPPETKQESRKEVRGAIGQIVWEWWRDSPASDDPRSQVQNLTDKIYSYFENRNTRSF